jgi:hypothetical protein
VQRCQAHPRILAIEDLQPGVGVADGQLDTDQAARHEAAQEFPPERLGLGLATSIESISCRPVSCTPCAMTSALATTRPPSRTFSTFGVEEQVGVAALQRPGAERLDVLVRRGADPVDLAARDPQPQALDQLVDAPVETPHTHACCTTASRACSPRLRGSRKPGK